VVLSGTSVVTCHCRSDVDTTEASSTKITDRITQIPQKHSFKFV